MRVWLLQRAEPTPHDNDGAQRLLRTGILARTLIAAGHQVTWFTSTFDHYNRRQRYDADRRVAVEPGYDVHYLHGPSYRRNISLGRVRNHTTVARRFAAFAAETTERPDIVVASIPTAELALAGVKFGRTHGIPVVLDIRDLWPDVFYDVLPGFLKPLVHLATHSMRRALEQATRDATAIIGLTGGFLDWGLERGGRTRGPDDRVFFMGYQGKKRVDADPVAAGRFWDELGVRHDPATLTVAFIGTLGFVADFDPVFEAARILQADGVPVRFIICGDGARRAKIETAAAELPNVVFPGWVTEDRIQALFDRAEIGLTPYIESTNFILNVTNKPAEYMSGGWAIANSLDRGALQTLLSERDCGFSYGGSGRTLATKLARLALDPDLLEGLRQRARGTFAELFHGESVYGEMVTYLEEVARKAAGERV